jgi:DNA-binding MarR family transcriptional regulator
LIERRPNPSDGRGVLIRLTPLGRELANDALAPVIDTQANSLGRLGASEQAALSDLLRELLVSLGDIPPYRPALAVKRMGR